MNDYDLCVHFKRANNGYIVEVQDTEDIYVHSESDDEHDAFSDFLYLLLQELGPSQGKYSDKYIYLTVDTGRDNDNHLGLIDPDGYKDKSKHTIRCMLDYLWGRDNGYTDQAYKDELVSDLKEIINDITNNSKSE